MKPDWTKAPVWANYVAKDQDGRWFWHEFKPTAASTGWLNKGHFSLARISEERDENWRLTLEEKA